MVHEPEAGPPLLYIDRHLLHEVTSPQAFDGLRLNDREVRRTDLTVATMDHNIPTDPEAMEITDPVSRKQVETLRKNCREFGVKLFSVENNDQGVIHVVMPERGLIQPGMTVVCGDSHTATHGAFGALAFGIGTSEIEHVLATQTLPQRKPETMELRLEGELPPEVSAKDVILNVISEIGTDGATGYALEFTGEVPEKMSMEGRMTLCNMAIEAGARSGMVAPDQTTFNYLREREQVPGGEAFEEKVEAWQQLTTDDRSAYDRRLELDLEALAPQVSWGTNPEMTVGVEESVPAPEDFEKPAKQQAASQALEYMDLEPGTPMTDIEIDRVFIGSCTNGRLEDLRAAAEIVEGNSIADSVNGLVVPGSMLVKERAEAEGLDEVFKAAGFEWRNAGCSMCLAMNDDKLRPGERCASTSNRNFEGRQGPGGRTHLVSPKLAAAAALTGHFVDIREWSQ